MPTYLVFSKNKEPVYKKISEMTGFDLNKKQPDLFVVEKEKTTISISQIRDVIKYLSLRPYNTDKKVVIIEGANEMTKEAQSAFLKTLEEAPDYAEIFLFAKNEKNILETTLSRCKKIHLENSTGEPETSNIETFLKMTAGERLDFIEVLSKEDKSDILVFLEVLAENYRKKMLTDDWKSRDTVLLNRIVAIHEDISTTNVNVRLALETLLLQDQT